MIAETAINTIIRVSDVYVADKPNEGRPDVDYLLNQVQKDIMKFAIAVELMEDEYYD